MSVTTKPKHFNESLNYPAKEHRALAKEPISVPRDPLITKYVNIKGEKVAPNNFIYSLYFTAFDARDYGPDIKRFIKIFEPLNIKKVYLETFRDGYFVPEKILIDAKKELEKEGITVSGAITTTHLSDRIDFNEIPAPTACYTDKAALKKLKEITVRTAEIFSEIIIDDWFFTICNCPNCKKAQGTKSKDEFRAKILFDAAKKCIVDPAREIRKKINLIIKFPQWYEDFHRAGYDSHRLMTIFDEAAAGTETRDCHQTTYMPVHGGMLFMYMCSLAPGKVRKAWFDPYICTKESFTEQAYQSVLAGAEELILFSAGILAQDNIREMVENLIAATGKIDRLTHFNNLFKVPMIKNPEAEGDDRLHQYFMMLGIPAYLTTSTHYKEKIAIITAQSGSKKDYLKFFNECIKKEKDMFMTISVARELKKYFNIEDLEETVQIEHVKYGGREYAMPGNVFIKNDIKGGKSLMVANGAHNLISFFKIKDSLIYVFNLPHTTDQIVDNTGAHRPADYRFMLRCPAFRECFKNIFASFANVNLYSKIKTFFKYDF